VKDDIKRLGSVNDDDYMWRNLTNGNRPTLPQSVNECVIRYGIRSCDVKR